MSSLISTFNYPTSIKGNPSRLGVVEMYEKETDKTSIFVDPSYNNVVDARYLNKGPSFINYSI